MYFSLMPDAVSESLFANLVVVLPIYNEEANIKSVVNDWVSSLDVLNISYQFLLINDGSKDKTLEVLKEIEQENSERIVIVNKPNAGHGRSCRLGYDACVNATEVEWVLQIDSDGQCDPEYFKTFWMKKENTDCVFGQRVKREDGFSRVITSKLCKWFSSFAVGKQLEDPNVPYRLMRKTVLQKALIKIPPSFDIHNVALTAALQQDATTRWERVPITFKDRQGGDNSIQVINVMQMGLTMLFDLRKLKKSFR